ncbi:MULTISPECIES: hypothetical protein [unclassified Streptococcus]|uniref:hypothetical protein n=1 Tax=unclassified Streptococcus TaxID=2608887 RepID=UPI00107230F7|nr:MULTISPECIES: hypothetical protein [unclassified Streptococcus]MBF0788171.1 hypothetical protein [Streptococcus sp. 19428wC2_LYSM12]MCQ9212276.1 hypothetical protein [Streptococcus sp. B01]MCQ9213607.1 hypothetical protein [Streptococcus sp. O1]TFV04771.1 hypothetical protein E4T79_09805 [Streptococcus sp. LYSM12]
MNKRIKKKRELVSQVQGTKEAVDIVLGIIKNLIDENTKQADEIFELRSTVERNALATNSELKILHDKLKKPKKKSFFNRK